MTTETFLKIYDNNDKFSEVELMDLWCGDTEVHMYLAEGETCGPLGRWNTTVSKVVKITDRYFRLFKEAGNTEDQESYWYRQPQEVYPVEQVMITWKEIPR